MISSPFFLFVRFLLPTSAVKVSSARQKKNPTQWAFHRWGNLIVILFIQYFSRTGEVLASRRDFRLNTSNLHACGSMLLDTSHLNQLEISLSLRPASTPAPNHPSMYRNLLVLFSLKAKDFCYHLPLLSISQKIYKQKVHH